MLRGSTGPSSDPPAKSNKGFVKKLFRRDTDSAPVPSSSASSIVQGRPQSVTSSSASMKIPVAAVSEVASMTNTESSKPGNFKRRLSRTWTGLTQPSGAPSPTGTQDSANLPQVPESRRKSLSFIPKKLFRSNTVANAKPPVVERNGALYGLPAEASSSYYSQTSPSFDHSQEARQQQSLQQTSSSPAFVPSPSLLNRKSQLSETYPASIREEDEQPQTSLSPPPKPSLPQPDVSAPPPSKEQQQPQQQQTSPEIPKQPENDQPKPANPSTISSPSVVANILTPSIPKADAIPENSTKTATPSTSSPTTEPHTSLSTPTKQSRTQTTSIPSSSVQPQPPSKPPSQPPSQPKSLPQTQPQPQPKAQSQASTSPQVASPSRKPSYSHEEVLWPPTPTRPAVAPIRDFMRTDDTAHGKKPASDETEDEDDDDEQDEDDEESSSGGSSTGSSSSSGVARTRVDDQPPTAKATVKGKEKICIVESDDDLVDDDDDENEVMDAGRKARIHMIQRELETRWILNISMHYRDRPSREKFVITYRESPKVTRRITISVDYRKPEPGTLEDDLSRAHYPRDRHCRIYESIRDSLPEIKFFNTVTNLKLQTTRGRLHVHVVEDVHEIISYPQMRQLENLSHVFIDQKDIRFLSHLSGFVYKVQYKKSVYVLKEIPSPDSVEHFLYEVNALNALRSSNHVIKFRGVVVDEKKDHVTGLLIEYAEQGPLTDILYDSRHDERRYGLTWEKRLKWVRQIIQGLSDIHEAGFIQGDFTLSNIVVDGKGDIKIIDLNRRGCPLGWEPPEISHLFDNNQALSMYIGVKSDLFQLGMVLWGIAMQDDEPEIQERPLYLGVDSDAPAWYKMLASMCLSADPRSRTSATNMLGMIPHKLDLSTPPRASRIAARKLQLDALDDSVPWPSAPNHQPLPLPLMPAAYHHHHQPTSAATAVEAAGSADMALAQPETKIDPLLYAAPKHAFDYPDAGITVDDDDIDTYGERDDEDEENGEEEEEEEFNTRGRSPCRDPRCNHQRHSINIKIAGPVVADDDDVILIKRLQQETSNDDHKKDQHLPAKPTKAPPKVARYSKAKLDDALRLPPIPIPIVDFTYPFLPLQEVTPPVAKVPSNTVDPLKSSSMDVHRGSLAKAQHGPQHHDRSISPKSPLTKAPDSLTGQTPRTLFSSLHRHREEEEEEDRNVSSTIDTESGGSGPSPTTACTSGRDPSLRSTHKHDPNTLRMVPDSRMLAQAAY